MKMTIEIDCSPQEARTFLGLPDVTALNDKLVEEMQKRMTANMAMVSPDELMKNWAAFGAGAHQIGVGALTQAEPEGVDGDGFTGTCFPRDAGHACMQLQLEEFDDGEVLNGQLSQHGAPE